jgi:hypothetical protein
MIVIEPTWRSMIRDDFVVPTSTTFISFTEFLNRNFSPVVESMPTVDLSESIDRRSRRIVKVKPTWMLVLPPMSATYLHHRY